MAVGDFVARNIWGGLSNDFKKKNFSLYGQWISIITVFLCLAMGIANIVHFSVIPVFAIICIIQGLVVIFVEIPFLLKICPFTDTFVNFIKKFNGNLPRCGFYLLNAVIQYLSLVVEATSLLVVAIMFTISSACYALAALKHQEFLTTSLDATGMGSQSNDLESQGGQPVVRNVL
ncbi:TVP18 Golgi apparatus membrane protein TVP18 [Candida maltosa Xu316]|uniref:Golgi apparatus membrane protein TVP18 n=1 Tax=Candida maltosa (strain Xu316) TaxID=1245528 RepID=M3JBW6_CANMX|nr:Golgi apparatus membrane protein TVP18 [Candida maltosa Xu316]